MIYNYNNSFPLIELINKGNNFLIASHISPDLDCICSSLALGFGLSQMGKSVRYFSQGPFDDNGISEYSSYFSNSFELLDNEILILVDCHCLNRISSESIQVEKDFIALDHHEEEVNEPNCHCLIMSHMPSTTMIVKKILDDMNISITEEIAKFILKGFFYDTDFFKYIKNEALFTINDAANIIQDHNISLKEMYAELYNNKSLLSRKFLAKMLSDFQLFYNDKIAFFITSLKDIETFGKANMDDSTLYDLILQINSVQVIIHLKEKGDNILTCSLRSKSNVNIREVAKSFGGGGHINASAFRVECSDTEKIKQDILQKSISELKSDGK